VKFRTVLIQVQALQRCVTAKDTFSLNWDSVSLFDGRKRVGMKTPSSGGIILHKGPEIYSILTRLEDRLNTPRGGLNCSVNSLLSLNS